MVTEIKCVYYLDSLMRSPESLADIAEKLAVKIEASKLEYSTVAFRGFSGAVIAPLVSLRVKKHLCGIRKETSHSSYKAEGLINGDYIVIDDLIDSGATMETIHEEIIKAWAEHYVTEKLIVESGDCYPDYSAKQAYQLTEEDLAKAPKMKGIFLYHSGRDYEWELDKRVELFQHQRVDFTAQVPVVGIEC